MIDGLWGRISDYKLCRRFRICCRNHIPRKARIDAPGCLHNIIARGIDRRLLYEDDTDRDIFLIREYFTRVVNRVGTLLGLEPAEVFTCSKRRGAVAASSLVYFWAHRDLGLSQIALTEKFGISQPAGSAAMRKGEKIVKAAGYELIES